MQNLKRLGLLLLLLSLVYGLAAPAQATQEDSDAIGRGVALEWMQALLMGVKTESIAPPQASRIYAYGAITLYEAFAPDLTGYQSLYGQLPDLPAPPQRQNAPYDPALVATNALMALSENLFGAASDETQTALQSLRARHLSERRLHIEPETFERSVIYGQELGERMAAWAEADNYALIRPLAYHVPTDEAQYWEPIAGQMPLQPYWGLLRPFSLGMTSACDQAPAVSFSEAADSAFYAEALEVKTMLDELNAEQELIARFWADNPGQSSTPPGHWVLIQNQLVEQLDLNLGQTLEMYTLTNIALADAFISAWDTKYHYNILRPITYIQRYIDPDWQTLINTPPFPDYPSGHSVCSGAAATVLTALFGEVGFTDVGTQPQFSPRSFSDFEAAAQEAALSRLYGGIHYRFSIEQGLDQGGCVGRRVLARLQLRV